MSSSHDCVCVCVCVMFCDHIWFLCSSCVCSTRSERQATRKVWTPSEGKAETTSQPFNKSNKSAVELCKVGVCLSLFIFANAYNFWTFARCSETMLVYHSHSSEQKSSNKRKKNHKQLRFATISHLRAPA